jgi:hypothetical protein
MRKTKANPSAVDITKVGRYLRYLYMVDRAITTSTVGQEY